MMIETITIVTQLFLTVLSIVVFLYFIRRFSKRKHVSIPFMLSPLIGNILAYYGFYIYYWNYFTTSRYATGAPIFWYPFKHTIISIGIMILFFLILLFYSIISLFSQRKQ
ncbi:hypothetical protein SAMN05216514_10125 [Kandleria vitulina]|nr:hypothetical protein SAMN05216514_10125 [Kandleria vitulina]